MEQAIRLRSNGGGVRALWVPLLVLSRVSTEAVDGESHRRTIFGPGCGPLLQAHCRASGRAAPASAAGSSAAWRVTARLGAKRDFEVWTYDSDNSTSIKLGLAFYAR